MRTTAPLMGLQMRSTLLNIALAFGALLLALLGVELALHYAGYNPFGHMLDSHESIVRESAHPGLIYELTPGARRTIWGGIPFNVNSAGMRDREYARKKPDGVYRIIVLGDSIAAATISRSKRPSRTSLKPCSPHRT